MNRTEQNSGALLQKFRMDGWMVMILPVNCAAGGAPLSSITPFLSSITPFLSQFCCKGNGLP
jgi:hypothetical protein